MDYRRDLDQGRMRILDAKPVNLDGFSVPDPELGLVAMRSPHDPEPSLVIRDGVVVELDGKAAADFDVIDEFIARYGLDLDVAEEAMALDDQVLARMAVDVNVPRAQVVRLIGGTTPAKLARVVAMLSPVEMQMAMARLRARRTPSNQAHVTNQLDDPLLIAADAASAHCSAESSGHRIARGVVDVDGQRERARGLDLVFVGLCVRATLAEIGIVHFIEMARQAGELLGQRPLGVITAGTNELDRRVAGAHVAEADHVKRMIQMEEVTVTLARMLPVAPIMLVDIIKTNQDIALENAAHQ